MSEVDNLLTPASPEFLGQLRLLLNGQGRWPNLHRTHTHPLPSVVRGIDVVLRSSTVLTAGAAYFPDEDAANRIVLAVGVPPNWDGTSDLTVRSWWFSDAAGLVDLENATAYIPDTVGADMDATTIVAMTNNNITFTGANKYRAVTTTIAAASLAAGRLVQISFRRNTGDANTGSLIFQGARGYTGLF